MKNVVVIEHPLVQHKLGLLRRKNASTATFRQLVREISPLMLYEATRDLPTTMEEIETPFERLEVPFLAGKKLCIVPIMRAGLALAEPMLEIIPSARVGHIGLYRHPETHHAVEYYCRLPDDLASRHVFIVDPLLATGRSAAAALDRLVESGAREIRIICLLASPEGIETVRQHYPAVQIFAAAVDRELDANAYIRPGLGDAGDRLFGTA